MEMSGKKNVQSIKDRLIEYRERERDIDNQIERIENLEAKMVSLQSPEISGMPTAHSVVKDKICKMIAQKDEMEKQVRRLIEIQDFEREWISGILSCLKSADERACIQMRYLDVESWPKVSKMLFGHYEDYEERRDSYLRRTTKIHGRALKNISDYLEE